MGRRRLHEVVLMRIWTVLLFVLYATRLPVASPAASHDADVATTLQRLERFKFDAQQHGDIVILDAMLDGALIWVDEDGALSTKAAHLEGLRNSSARPVRVVPESMTVKVFDGVAIVFGIYDKRGVKAGHPYHQRCRFIDTWVFKNGRWLCIAATATSAIS